LNEAVSNAARRFADAGLRSPRREAQLLWDHASKMGVGVRAPPSGASLELFQALAARRLAHEPFAYLVGHKEFWSLDLVVGPGVLIPRPETETLIEEAVRSFPDSQKALAIADLGTGSGCLLVAALHVFTNAHGVGIDSSSAALAYARQNVEAQGMDSRATLIETGWPEDAEPGFDIVFANPPYIPTSDIESLMPDVRLYEPRAALDGGKDGLEAYRALSERLPRLLGAGGQAFLEVGVDQAFRVADLAVANGLKVLRVVPDLAGIPRCVVLALNG